MLITITDCTFFFKKRKKEENGNKKKQEVIIMEDYNDKEIHKNLLNYRIFFSRAHCGNDIGYQKQ